MPEGFAMNASKRACSVDIALAFLSCSRPEECGRFRRSPQRAVYPPSTTRLWPVTNAAASEASQSTASAISATLGPCRHLVLHREPRPLEVDVDRARPVRLCELGDRTHDAFGSGVVERHVQPSV